MESVHVSKVAVLDKVIAIVGTYERGANVLEPRTVAERTGFSLPTVYRLMQAMTAHDLLVKDGTGFRPGIGLLRLGGLGAAAFDLRRSALPHLNWLGSETEENAE